ncbi:hypothetical protein K1T71_007844 [Dendrolimus kikuchii]|uniref:Uncharacterized protein n=1 Tax=Dendrolimus kikuchii TaxID=765133 RepID=A0ACC1CYM1_9NEOP|nr:hypothetical protein K1T71_007844 [Dendrolimus kikuchii]
MEFLPENSLLTLTQTQTQNSDLEWSQSINSFPSIIPTIWGRLYTSGKHFWKNLLPTEYFDLVQPDFSLGRALTCTLPLRKDTVKEALIKNVSKLHFTIKRDLSVPLSPAIITDLSHNGTYVNGLKIGRGNSQVLDDKDEIGITHELVKIFVFQDLLKNEQDQVPKVISEKYYISKILGQGACGIVKLVYDKKKCTKHAMKVIKKNRLSTGQVSQLNDPVKIMNEIKIMKALRHPCIISIEEVFDFHDAVYIILELMEGGELFDKISKQGKLPEKHTRFLFRQMVLAVKYLHSQGITHRDLKPENVLLESMNENTLVKISDFGLSKFVGEDSFMKTMCGTPLYLAPEVLKSKGQKSYGPQVDVWSLGVVFFICLAGYVPFSNDYHEMSLIDQITNGKYKISESHWKGVSLQAKLLMKRMLTVKVEMRITLDQILSHAWMQDSDVIIRVERLLSYTAQNKNMSQLSITSTSSSEKENEESNTTVIRAIAFGKRTLSDTFSSCEPIPKKLCVALCLEKEDTSSIDSYCTGE